MEGGTQGVGNEARAERARTVAVRLGDTLHEKQMAYGDSGAIALGLWEARLKQYLSEDGTHYVVPRALIAHIPRITRLDDRINRIISNPDGDRLGEDPWLDAAGDCIIGAISPRVVPVSKPAPKPVPAAQAYPAGYSCYDKDCEMGRHPPVVPHAKVSAAGREQWVDENICLNCGHGTAYTIAVRAEFAYHGSACGIIGCACRHHHAARRATDNYTHGFVATQELTDELTDDVGPLPPVSEEAYGPEPDALQPFTDAVELCGAEHGAIVKGEKVICDQPKGHHTERHASAKFETSWERRAYEPGGKHNIAGKL